MNEHTFETMESHDGRIVDARIEHLLFVVQGRMYEAPGLDEVFNHVIQDYLSNDAPEIHVADIIAPDKVSDGQAIALIHLFGMTLSFTTVSSVEWPSGGFAYLPDAPYAAAVRISGDEEFTPYYPGETVNCAIISAILGYC
jgi:hypothetical protein